MARRYRGRRRRGHKQPFYRKILKTAANAGAGFLIASPVLIPGVYAIQRGLLGQPGGVLGADPVAEFVYEAGGFNLTTGQLETGKLQQVIMRDVALVGIGMGLRWAAKRV